eukprot:TRINITY_DN3516_c0_g1_i1.p1 TRINITY_DN3516_c0_g1~~TRINITY_DN3516_c0_g1_i1.p1  ORF type:complete len:129 (+),score=25.35 TRINITY_DN3516_c0_g1_i1:336-722(+)
MGNYVYLINYNCPTNAVDSVKDGLQIASLTSYCTYKLCQDIEGLKKGKTYTISFWAAIRVDSLGNDDFIVTINDKIIRNVPSSDLDIRWNRFTASFKSSGKTDTLCFYDIDSVTDFYGALIDDVVLCA